MSGIIRNPGFAPANLFTGDNEDPADDPEYGRSRLVDTCNPEDLADYAEQLFALPEVKACITKIRQATSKEELIIATKKAFMDIGKFATSHEALISDRLNIIVDEVLRRIEK